MRFHIYANIKLVYEFSETIIINSKQITISHVYNQLVYASQDFVIYR